MKNAEGNESVISNLDNKVNTIKGEINDVINSIIVRFEGLENKLKSFESDSVFRRRGLETSNGASRATIVVVIAMMFTALAGIVVLRLPADFFQTFISAQGPVAPNLPTMTNAPIQSAVQANQNSSIESQNANEGSDAYSQFMTLFLAVAAGGVAFLASAMGMKRLESYDGQFSEFRSELRTIESGIDARFDFLAADFKDKSEYDLRKRLADIEMAAQVRIENKSGEIRKDFESKRNELEKIRDDMDDRYGKIVASTDTTQIMTDNPSVSELHDKVTEWFRKKEGKKAREVVRAILNFRDPSTAVLRTTGGSNDWFNLSAELGRSDEYMLGVKVALAGLVQQGVLPVDTISNLAIRRDEHGRLVGYTVPRQTDVDLIAHAINYGSKIGLDRLVGDLFEIVELVAVDDRGWRYYQFLADYWDKMGDKGRFDRIVDEFAHRMPLDERATGLRLQWAGARDDVEAMARIGEEWMADPKRRGTSVPLRLTELALRYSDYEKALTYSARALEGAAESQPNASISAMLFYRANAFDGLFVQATQADTLDCAIILGHYHNAKRLYRSILVERSSTIQSSAASNRLEVMALLLAETGCNDEDPRAGPDQPQNTTAPEERDLIGQIGVALDSAARGDSNDARRLAELIRGYDESLKILARHVLSNVVRDNDYPETVREAAQQMLSIIGLPAA